MKKAILPLTGAFAFGLVTGVTIFILWFLPHYQHSIDHAHYADKVIEECIDQYPDFYDTIVEGDNWASYELAKELD